MTIDYLHDSGGTFSKKKSLGEFADHRRNPLNFKYRIPILIQTAHPNLKKNFVSLLGITVHIYI